MNDIRSSNTSPIFETLTAVVLFAAVGTVSLLWFYDHGYLLYYGDALSHLNIARRILDSRTPGLDQIGTVWLPLPHLLMLPFTGNDALWRSGLAGSIPSVFCFILAGGFLFAAVRSVSSSSSAAFAAAGLFALNPNVLYLQSIPMTEAMFFSALFALLYFTVAFRRNQSLWAVAGAGISALAGTLTRYEGWFLIPFVTLYFLLVTRRNRWRAAFLFGAIATAGPLYWLAHNWWFFGDALEFYRGQWSAKAIYERSLGNGMGPYPGDGDWGRAARQFVAAVRLCAGWPLVFAGVAGVAGAIWSRRWWPLVLLGLPPVFYIWSIHSSGTPIFVPHLWPNSYYNTRYGLAALPLLAVAGGLLVSVIPHRWRSAAAFVVVVVSVLFWSRLPAPEGWICWKESQVNSRQRRAWTAEAARYLRANYRGGGILTSFGDLGGVYLEAGIPLRETLHSGNEPLWRAAVNRPDLFLWEKWAVAYSGDPVATAILRARRTGPRYECVKMIALRDAPVIEIYRRVP